MEISLQHQNVFQSVFSQPHTILFALCMHVIMKPFYLEKIGTDQFNELMTKLVETAQDPQCPPLRDTDVLRQMNACMTQHIYRLVGAPINENVGRCLSRVEDIVSILTSIRMPPIQTYVDIGCSEGGITQLLGHRLRIPEVIGVDIIDESKLTEHSFKYVKQTENATHLPLESNSVDLVSALMSFHHVKHVEEYISEIVRILKPGGMLILQEHNIETEHQTVALHILHAMYCAVWNIPEKLECPDICENYYAKYFSDGELRILLQHAGLKRCSWNMNIYLRAIPRQNPFGNYWALYMKA